MLGKRFDDDGVPLLHLNRLQMEMKDAINLKIQENVYRFELVQCCICLSTEFDPLASKDRYGLRMAIVVCKKCGLVQTNPRMSEDAYREFYNSEYRKLYSSVEGPTDEFFQFQRRRGSKIYQYLLKHEMFLKPLNDMRIPEIGCGAGGILHYFKELGFQVKGVDIGQDYLDYGRSKYGLDLSLGTIFDVNSEERFDIIIYSHVLEHIVSPNEDLKQSRKLLSEKGILYLEVPSIKYMHRRFDIDFLKNLQNAHVYYFSPITLNNLLEHNGFELVIGNESIKSVFMKKTGQKSDLNFANDHAAVIRYLKRLPYHPYQLIDFPRRMVIKLLKILGLYALARNLYRIIIRRV